MDKNIELKTAMKNAYIDLQVKYNRSGAFDKIKIKPELDALAKQINVLNMKLLNEATVVTDGDMLEMAEIKKEIDAAASKQQLIAAIAKAVAFVAKKVM